jgi:hypothetical protein
MSGDVRACAQEGRGRAKQDVGLLQLRHARVDKVFEVPTGGRFGQDARSDQSTVRSRGQNQESNPVSNHAG